MAFPEAGCGGGSGGALMAFTDLQTLVVRGRDGVLMAVSDAGFVGERRLFSRQGQMLVVRVRGGGSHGSPRRWLWGERRGFSWHSQTLVVDGRGGGSNGNPRYWMLGG